MADFDYLQSLRDDLLEQFRGKPNTEVFLKAIARQLQDVWQFFDDLQEKRGLETAFGRQLDGIGDIVGLSRGEAGNLANLSVQSVVMDDELYREYLRYKVHINTNIGTYQDVHKALKMFWDASPFYYSEDATSPATMLFRTPVANPEEMAEALAKIPLIKPAGVALKILAYAEVPPILIEAYAGIAMAGMGLRIETEVKNYGAVE